jgi:CDP-diacylglycerol--glycerol-3-phosphate 3-phosphatidyltransferase
MTVSNAITVSRILLSPVFVALLVLCDRLGPGRNAALVVLWIVYFLIEFSDLADGFLARRLNQESELGKVLDPFADSLSRLSCFLAFTVAGILPLWIFMVVLYRDMWVNFLRLLTAKRGILQGARLTGKIKAWVYALANVACLGRFTADRVLPNSIIHDILCIFCLICFGCIVIIAVWSGIDYSASYFNRKNEKKKQSGS